LDKYEEPLTLHRFGLVCPWIIFETDFSTKTGETYARDFARCTIDDDAPNTVVCSGRWCDWRNFGRINNVVATALRLSLRR
jgi:hypothetical protein